MLTGYRATLIPDLGAADFADLHAQTAAYGLFAARCLHDRKRPVMGLLGFYGGVLCFQFHGMSSRIRFVL